MYKRQCYNCKFEGCLTRYNRREVDEPKECLHFLEKVDYNYIDLINEHTGFLNGNIFKNENEVLDYFRVENIELMFNDSHSITQDDLDEWSNYIILHKFHIKI